MHEDSSFHKSEATRQSSSGMQRIGEQKSVAPFVVLLLVVQVVLSAALLWRVLALERAIASSPFFSSDSPLLTLSNGVTVGIEPSALSLIENVNLGAAPPLGEADAPIVIIEFSDFGCPYCKESVETLQKLIENNPGKIRLYYRHAVPSSKEDSFLAALAAECANEQGRFWEMHDLLFDASPDFSESRLEQLADQLKLDEKQFSECLSSRKYEERVKADFEEAQKLQISGTPTFIINGRMLFGTQTLERLQTLVDEILATTN